MADWHILIADKLAPEGVDRLRNHAQVDNLAGISAEELAEKIGGYDALIVRSRTKVTAALLEKAPRLKIIARAGVGVDNIDLDAARQHGVIVVNTPVATTTAVAEHTIGLLLSLARHIPQADQSLKAGKWEKKSLVGMELSGKTMGIIGLGNIGKAVAKRIQAFDVQVIAYDPRRRAAVFDELQIEPVGLEELFARSEIISLHTPLSAETRNMLNAPGFDQMKPGVLILCTARGGIIDEDELLKRLESGQVGGVGLDVFAQEPPSNTALLNHPRVIVTPHIAAQTKEAQVRAALHAAEEIERKIKAAPLLWQIV
ncbi:hypothetical protein KQH61_05220 [bacterium]|nr:hypothetical protein [bacterium]MCB2179301.1 hypothetical protein [bacterium]